MSEIQDELNKYRQALEQEFKVEAAKEPDNVEALTRDFFKDNSAMAAAQIAWLSLNADSESVRLNASKYIIERGVLQANEDGDPIKDLLTQLKNNDAKTEGVTNE